MGQLAIGSHWESAAKCIKRHHCVNCHDRSLIYICHDPQHWDCDLFLLGRGGARAITIILFSCYAKQWCWHTIKFIFACSNFNSGGLALRLRSISTYSKGVAAIAITQVAGFIFSVTLADSVTAISVTRVAVDRVYTVLTFQTYMKAICIVFDLFKPWITILLSYSNTQVSQFAFSLL